MVVVEMIMVMVLVTPTTGDYGGGLRHGGQVRERGPHPGGEVE